MFMVVNANVIKYLMVRSLNVERWWTVKAGQMVAQWDPHTHPIITEVAGPLKFG